MSGRWPALLLTAILAGAAQAEALVTEVIPAGFRNAEELAEILRPMVSPPGSVNGFHGQIVIRTTPHNLAELRRILSSLDTAPANLLVTVRRTLDAQISQDLARGSARIGPDHARGALHLQHQARTHQGSDEQTLRVLEGKEAFIHAGESVPTRDRSVLITGSGVAITHGTRYEEFGNGFYVRPRLNGEHVVLDIIPSSRERRGDGSAAVREASTSISGPLGRWMQISTVDEHGTRVDSASASSKITRTRRGDGIYVKVQRLD